MKRSKQCLAIILLCVLMPAWLSGCYDANEITDFAYVYSIGFDKGVTDNLRVTIQIETSVGSNQNSTNQTGNGKSDSKGGVGKTGNYEAVTIDCPTFFSGVNLINTFLSRKVNYMHAKYVVFSEELARKGIGKYLNGIGRSREIRRQINVIIVKGTARKFIKNSFPILGSDISKYQEHIIGEENNTGLFINSRYEDVMNSIKSGSSQPIMTYAAVNNFKKYNKAKPRHGKFKPVGDCYAGQLVRNGGNEVEFLGSSVFNGDKMVGKLNGDESRMALMLRGEFERGYFAFPDPKGKSTFLTVDIRKQKSNKIDIDTKSKKPLIDVQVNLEGDILAIQSGVNYENLSLKPILEKQITSMLTKDMNKTIKKCQKMKSDVFKFGEIASEKFLTIEEWQKYHWLKKFKTAKVKVKVNFSVRRAGTMMKTSPIMSSGGEQ